MQVCPPKCIVPGRADDPKWNTYMIDPDTCIGCGVCVVECPFDAIFAADELPPQYADAAAHNAAFFATGPGYDWAG
ncbi:MAG: 4Fe-4S binding protein [Lentisphaeria bacterium]|jgi:Fe-S-cluster-containing hydrogenase component 2|nr:4Fe-4S binding protein [Lentisphaeria bacterium]|tara:strand:- start:123 stop:350 length:228 start_codon:yes stop_codon:yes gene_type:complete